MDPANFGPEGVSKCAPGITYVNAIPTGSLVNGGVRQADVFFGNMINANSPVPLSPSEATELAAFLNAGGVVYISGDGHGQGTPWNPLFVALGISDRFASDYITSGSVSLPLFVTPLTNGPFGTVGYMGWTPYSTITTATLTKVITAGGASNTMVAEGAFGAGYLSVTGDTVAHDFNTGSAANLRYMLNLFATGCQAPQLLIHQNVDPQVLAVGQSVTLALHIANLSNAPIADVVITDILPLQLTNTSYKSSGLTLTPVGATPYIWQAGVLAPQASGIITITGTIGPGVSLGRRSCMRRALPAQMGSARSPIAPLQRSMYRIVMRLPTTASRSTAICKRQSMLPPRTARSRSPVTAAVCIHATTCSKLPTSTSH